MDEERVKTNSLYGPVFYTVMAVGVPRPIRAECTHPRHDARPDRYRRPCRVDGLHRLPGLVPQAPREPTIGAASALGGLVSD